MKVYEVSRCRGSYGDYFEHKYGTFTTPEAAQACKDAVDARLVADALLSAEFGWYARHVVLRKSERVNRYYKEQTIEEAIEEARVRIVDELKDEPVSIAEFELDEPWISEPAITRERIDEIKQQYEELYEET